MYIELYRYQFVFRENNGNFVQNILHDYNIVHRHVTFVSGEILAKDFECCFTEVAAAEQVGQIAEVFLEVCREVLSVRRKNKQSLLDRMLGGKTAAVKAYARGKSDSALPKE